ncbi:MAG: RGCVC family protein [Pseudonocardia sp.]
MSTNVIVVAPSDSTEVTCAVCSHAQDAHDHIGIRYCSATAEGGFDRGCVCIGVTATPAAAG